MIRRSFLKAALLAGALSGSAWAVSPAPRVDVVKIMSLGCPVCRAAEGQDPVMAQTVQGVGGKFVHAPLPTGENDTGARERVYYAARDLDPALGAAVKTSLYKGMQDMSVPLTDYMQVYTWLAQDIPQYEPQFGALFQKAQEPAAGTSLSRAARLASSAGVSALPGYVVLVDGQVAALVDSESINSSSMSALREAVLERVKKLSKR